jgi:hypothetical protein
MTLYAVAGLPTKIDLPVPLTIDLIPTWQTNQRPGIPRRLPGAWVQHETANPSSGANAYFHNVWLHNGANGSQLSFHFVVDDHSIYQMIPVNEVTWQAADGAGNGNMAGVSCELCVNSDGNESMARKNAEALAGGVMKSLEMVSPDQCTRHYDYNWADPDRHHCPDHMMSEGYWPTFQANVATVITGGTQPMTFPKGWDAALCADLWYAIPGIREKYPTLGFNEKGPVSQLWLANWPLGPFTHHFKDKGTGREEFTFTNGIISRLSGNDAWAVTK